MGEEPSFKEPIDRYRDRCNDMCNSLWKYGEELRKIIKSLPEGQNKQYLQDYDRIISLIAELFYFQAVSMGQIKATDEPIIALFKEVFGPEGSITLPYEPRKGETLYETAKRYKEKEPAVNWLDKDLKDRAKDLENQDTKYE
jgi:hypothetical protein